jgi:putative zinc finger/helix-turn-helix YgiT family protein
MKCDECGGLMTTERNAVRRYAIGGLPHVELHGVEVTRCSACGKETIGIPRIGQLHRVLAESFVKQQRLLAPVEIRFLRKHIGLSTVDFAKLMGVTRETASRWETGSQTMGSVADRLLRLIVVNHEPPESYAVEDLLRELTDDPAPSRLTAVAMRNSRDDGWKPEHRRLARV